MTQNYTLFGKNLKKIATGTISKFGSILDVILFLQSVCDCGNVAFAAVKSTDISPIDLHKIIKSDKYLDRCVKLALNYAALTAEGVLYDRAINGYEELSYNKDGQCISRKKKYCSKSLLEYLKANCPKYQTVKKNSKIATNAAKRLGTVSYEVESYERKRA